MTCKHPSRDKDSMPVCYTCEHEEREKAEKILEALLTKAQKATEEFRQLYLLEQQERTKDVEDRNKVDKRLAEVTRELEAGDLRRDGKLAMDLAESQAKLAEVTRERDEAERNGGPMPHRLAIIKAEAREEGYRRFEAKLAESQAREAELRAALQGVLVAWQDAPPPAHAFDTGRAALARPANDSALREFGLKVVEWRDTQEGGESSPEECVDAVLRELRGER